MPFKVIIKARVAKLDPLHDLDKGNLEKECPFHNEH